VLSAGRNEVVRTELFDAVEVSVADLFGED
jgi:hypothetical protein